MVITSMRYASYYLKSTISAKSYNSILCILNLIDFLAHASRFLNGVRRLEALHVGGVLKPSKDNGLFIVLYLSDRLVF